MPSTGAPGPIRKSRRPGPMSWPILALVRRSSDRAGPCVASSDAARAPHRRDARRHAAALAPAQCRHGDARGLEVSPGGLLQYELVQRQIRDCLTQPAVLELKVLQALHLLGLQPAKLRAPPIIRHLAHPDLADCVQHILALRDQNIDLPQLRDNLFGLVSLPCHCSPPGCQRHTSSRTTSMGVDHRIAMAARRQETAIVRVVTQTIVAAANDIALCANS